MKSPKCSGASGLRKQALKAVYDNLASSAEAIVAFNTGFEPVSPHHPTQAQLDGVRQEEVAAVGGALLEPEAYTRSRFGST
jgi:hypothetical protein